MSEVDDFATLYPALYEASERARVDPYWVAIRKAFVEGRRAYVAGLGRDQHDPGDEDPQR